MRTHHTMQRNNRPAPLPRAHDNHATPPATANDEDANRPVTHRQDGTLPASMRLRLALFSHATIIP